jgi:RimJ/RimL family protein N-acetyltransferase
MSHFATPLVLHGTHVRLLPLATDHLSAMQDAVRDGELWKLWYTFIPKPEDMQAEIERRLGLQATGSMLPFAIERASDGQLVGMSTYMNIDGRNRRLEIGSTWYAASVQRTPLNTECKLLMLSHAFEQLECNAVEFRTHFINQQSRRAIERLGAKLDGILRSHQIMPDGSLRDTAVYSILAHEWPMVRNHLRWQLGKRRD